MSLRILVLGATGMLGQPVTRFLVARGHRVRVLARSVDKPFRIFGDSVEIVQGSALDKDRVGMALSGCDAVHISLPQDSELTATRHVVDLAQEVNLRRVTYVSATSACEENRWFEVVDVKVRTEDALRRSEIDSVIFRPTWAIETLLNFVHGQRVMMIIGRNPPPLHFFAAADFGRIVAASYDDDRALGKQLYVHGPEAISLPEALERFVKRGRPELKILRIQLWQAQLLAKLIGRLNYISRLIAFFDQVGELGDPAETNSLFGAPSIRLDQWIRMSEETDPASLG